MIPPPWLVCVPQPPRSASNWQKTKIYLDVLYVHAVGTRYSSLFRLPRQFNQTVFLSSALSALPELTLLRWCLLSSYPGQCRIAVGSVISSTDSRHALSWASTQRSLSPLEQFLPQQQEESRPVAVGITEESPAQNPRKLYRQSGSNPLASNCLSRPNPPCPSPHYCAYGSNFLSPLPRESFQRVAKWCC